MVILCPGNNDVDNPAHAVLPEEVTGGPVSRNPEAKVLEDDGMRSVCVYCGSSDQVHPGYREAAGQMGAAIAARGLELVYGAGSTGLMGAMVEHARNEGFIYAEHRALFTHAADPEALLDALRSHSPPPGLDRWLSREE